MRSPLVCLLRFGACLFLFAPVARAADSDGLPLVVRPTSVKLQGNFAQAQLLVRADTPQAQAAANEVDAWLEAADLTLDAEYVSADPKIVEVIGPGHLLAKTNGQTTVTITRQGQKLTVPVEVTDIVESPDFDFHKTILPVLSKHSCNAGACHAAQYGQGGLKLSVFGFDPAADFEAIIRDRQVRRINRLKPEESLLLLKPTMGVSHGGGLRLEKGSIDYQILSTWLTGPLTPPQKTPVKVTKIEVFPSDRLGKKAFDQQMQVIATLSDGTVQDVTAWAKYDSIDESIASVTEAGHVKVFGRGQTAIMVRYEGQANVMTVVVPFAAEAKLEGWKSQNFVDELAARKFRELGIEPSPLCDDATFIRRAFLDAIGTQPTTEEVRAFLDSKDPNKRNDLIDRLLGLTGDPDKDIYNNDYAAFWTLRWSDLIRTTSAKLGEQGMWSLHNWIKQAFRENWKFDRFVSELITAKGSIYTNGPANYFRVASNAEDLAESTAQLFLGVRLQCAKCHHHPFEKYSQGDYYGFAAFFSRVGSKNSSEFGLFGRETVVMVRSTGEVSHPRTRERMMPTPLDGEAVDHPLDRRIPLAKWLTQTDNEFFAKNVVNRYVAFLLGRGLVEPVDDLRSTNPPSNAALLNALSDDFTKSGFDLKHLIRTIMQSRLYQLDYRPTAENEGAAQFYPYFQVKRVGAESLVDVLDYVTGVKTKFKNLPLETKAIELPDAEYPHFTLTTFGKPKRASVCECERGSDLTLAQILHTLNGDELTGKIADKSGRVAELVKEKKSHDEIVTELFLLTLCRFPTEEELAQCRFTEGDDTVLSDPEYYQDLLWALINSKQFLFNH